MRSDESAVERLARVFKNGSSDSEINATVNKMIHDKDSLLAVKVGILFRDQHDFANSGKLLQKLIDLNHTRDLALYELAVCRSLDGDPHQAIYYLEALSDIKELMFHQHIALATNLARCCEHKAAIERLQVTKELFPTKSKDIFVYMEFFNFLKQTSVTDAKELLDKLHSEFSFPSLAAIEEAIFNALEKKLPFLLMRMGDGEGSFIDLGVEDSTRNFLLYNSNRKEWHNFWFLDESILDDTQFENAIDEFNKAISKADIIGAFSIEMIDHEYRIGSKRGIPYIVNLMRKVLDIGEKDNAWKNRVQLSRLTVHYDLLSNGTLSRLLTGRHKIGLISCHHDLPKALQMRFGIIEVKFIHIPGEQSHKHILGSDAVVGRHWPDRYDEVIFEIENMDCKGMLFLTAAGFLGKIYASKLKDKGAVVIDIGAVADAVLKRNTRTFPDFSPDLLLNE